MEPTIHLRNETSELSIAIRDYETRGASLASGDSWLRCEFSVHLGPFAGTYGGYLTTDEVEALLEDLGNLVDNLVGTASFKPMEAALDFEVEMGPRGNGVVTGCARPMGPPRAVLDFAFETDQSYLRMTLEDVRRAVGLFPRIQEVREADTK